MAELNFHHLRYFWAVAHRRHLTKAAEALHISPSALSIQLRQLEDRLGHDLFERKNRRLELTEAGRIALEHADAIFKTGQELINTLQGTPSQSRPILRVGAVATLSRNFQMGWLLPLLKDQSLGIRLVSGQMRELLSQLASHSLDVVLSNESAPRDTAAGWISRRIAHQPVSLVSRPLKAGRSKARPLKFPDDLDGQELILPSQDSAVRLAFDLILEEAAIRPQILAEVDDMAMLRLLARETGALALVPPVVVTDELKSGILIERCTLSQLQENFYAITMRRRFAHPALRSMLGLG
ncbi:MAG: LysR family transcriptional regulator [Actinobacteria bacterium]|nr:LysR family transcriptional regulator [Actinomycetota bacterium]